MNKIILENNSSLKDIHFEEDAIVIINSNSSRISFHIDKKVKVFTLITDSSLELDLFVSSDSSINVFSVNTSIDVIANLSKNGINFNYNYSTINSADNRYFIDINHLKKGIISKITNHGINLNDSKLSFIINTVVPKNVSAVKTSQDSKIIIFGDNNATIKPNLLIDNDDIEADHAAYIGRIKESDLFYLMSRGITLKDAEELLIKSFLIGNMNISFEEKEIVLNTINKYWR